MTSFSALVLNVYIAVHDGLTETRLRMRALTMLPLSFSIFTKVRLGFILASAQ